MKKEELFLQKITELKETAKLQGQVVSKEQIAEFIEENELNEEQSRLLYEYLKQNKIGIDEKINPDEYLTKEDVSYLEVCLKHRSWHFPWRQWRAKRMRSTGCWKHIYRM